MPAPEKIVYEMLQKDAFSKWLGIEIIEVKDGYCKLKMTIREEMVNGFGIAHGGIMFSLADTAFAFACNSRNNLSVTSEATINFIKTCSVGDILIAEAKELHNGQTTGLYQIFIYNQKEQLVGLFKGTCHHLGKKIN